MFSETKANGPGRMTRVALRWGLYLLLFLLALYYLAPLFVMLTTSLKTLEEIRTGSLISLPGEVTLMLGQQHGRVPVQASNVKV